MNWGRYIQRTAVRRVVWILVGVAVYSLLGAISDARAAVNYPSRGEAYTGCMAAAEGAYGHLSQTNPSAAYHSPRCDNWGTYYLAVLLTSNGQARGLNQISAHPYESHHYWTVECPNGGEWREDLEQCAESCAARSDTTDRPPFVPAGLPWRNGAIQCNNGCLVGYVGGLGDFLGVHTGGQCTGNGPPDGGCEGVSVQGVQYQNSAFGCIPPPTDCKPYETRDPATGACSMGCPAGQILTGHGECVPEMASCPPGQTKAPDGSCLPSDQACPVGQALGRDGSCKRDSNNDGVPDEDEDGGDGTNKDGMEFSGGDSCLSPPTCSGDAIMCGQARIQWRIDCNTRRAANITGGTCEAMPICAGENCDATEYAQLIQQWRTACALAKLADGGGIIGGDDGDGDGGTAELDIEGFITGVVDGASGTSGDGGDPSGAFSDGSEGGDGTGELDTGGLGFGNSCPQLPSVNVMGVTLDFNTVGPDLCNWMTLGGHIVLILSSLVSLRILAGGMNV